MLTWEGTTIVKAGLLLSGPTPGNNAAVRYDSSTVGAFYVNWMEERIYRIETEEGFDLADLLHELAMLELKALGDTKHGVERF
jgi:hypothetical protein